MIWYFWLVTMNSQLNIDTWFWLENYENGLIENQTLKNTFNHETIIVPDLHGNFEAYKNILLRAELIDSEMNWKWWNTHVVFLWDIIFDKHKQWIQIVLSIDLLKQQAQLHWWDLKTIAWNHEETWVGTIANYNSDFPYYQWLIWSNAFKWIWEFESFITQWERSMLPKMKEEKQWTKLLKIISNFSLIERFWATLMVHTDVTSDIIDEILTYWIYKVNKEYSTRLKTILYPELGLTESILWDYFKNKFTYHWNRSTFNKSRWELLSKIWVKNIFHWHSDRNLLIKNVWWVNIFPLDKSYWVTAEAIKWKETFAKIQKNWEIIITKDGRILDGFGTD